MPRERDERRRERLLRVRRRQTERLQELGVVREPALPVLVPDADSDFLAVDGQLLVAQADVGRLREILGDGIGEIEPLEGLNVALVSLQRSAWWMHSPGCRASTPTSPSPPATCSSRRSRPAGRRGRTPSPSTRRRWARRRPSGRPSARACGWG